MQERRVLCLLACLSPPSLFLISKLETGIRRGAFFFFTPLGEKGCVVVLGILCGFVCFSFFFPTFALTLPLLPACSLTSGSCCSVTVSAGGGGSRGHLGLGPRCRSPLAAPGRSPRCSLSPVPAVVFRLIRALMSHCSLTLRETGLDQSA